MPACCVCTSSESVYVCVHVHHSICVCAGLVVEQSETIQCRADLHYHSQAGSLVSVPRYLLVYSNQTHPSQYCCGVHRAHSFSGSAVLHKETVTKTKQAPTTGRGGGVTERGHKLKNEILATRFITDRIHFYVSITCEGQICCS